MPQHLVEFTGGVVMGLLAYDPRAITLAIGIPGLVWSAITDSGKGGERQNNYEKWRDCHFFVAFV